METGKKYKLADKCITPGGRNITRDEIEKFSSVGLDCFETDREEDWYKIGCIDGLDAADADPDTSSLWHDASEEPEGVNWEILCQDKNDGCWVENRIEAQLLHKNWNAYTEIEMIVRWAYISDLLPKGGEK